MTKPDFAGDGVARATLWSIVLLLTVETLVEVVLAKLGLNTSRFTFLWRLNDVFGDYFNFVLSFPAKDSVHASAILRDQVAVALSPTNPYRTGIPDLAHALYSHFHTPPLVALFCVANAALMRVVDPGMLFVAVLTGLAAYWIVIAVAAGRTSYQRFAFALAGLLSYPMLLMAARGNVYAGAAGLLIVHAMTLVVRRERPVLAAVLLALAINIRPNALVLLPLLPLLYDSFRLRTLLIAPAAAGAVFAVALAAATFVYPDYRWSSFMAGLAVYYRGYVLDDFGLAFGSSTFGAAKFLLGFRPGLDFWTAVPGFAIIGAAVMLGWRRRIEPAVLLFLLSAGYCLSSAVFSDYHLLPFVAVPLALASGGRPPSPRERCALLASCLVLAPKCYVFGPSGLSPQVLFNPVILLLCATWVIGLALIDLRGTRTRFAPVFCLEAA